MTAASDPSVAELLELRRGNEKDTFIGVYNPVRMGNAADIAYGGCALASAVMAAFHTVENSDSKCMYSMMGNYLGPARCDRPLFMTVTRLRSTKTFDTRYVLVSQEQDDGTMRSCVSATADFIVSPTDTDGPDVSLLRYNPPVRHTGRPSHSDLPLADEWFEQRVKSGDLNPKFIKILKTVFEPWHQNMETKYCPEGIFGQNLNGIDKKRITTLHRLHVTERTSSQWNRLNPRVAGYLDQPSRQGSEAIKPTRRALNTAICSFFLDGALSFMPLSVNNLFMDDAGACSSLDFAMRLFVPAPSLEDWLYIEHRPISAGFGRTYSEARWFKEDGTLVASMTQASILRPKTAKM